MYFIHKHLNCQILILLNLVQFLQMIQFHHFNLVFFMVIGQSEYIIKKIKEESKLKNVRVIATGGLGRIIFDETNLIDEYDKDLTLKCLYYISKL